LRTAVSLAVDARGAAAGVRRDFVCECGDPICDVEVTVTVKEAARAPVLAPGHAADDR